MPHSHSPPTGPRRWWRRLLSLLGLRPPPRPARTPAEEMEVAYRAVSEGDLPHAAFHAGAALFADPANRDAARLLERAVAAMEEKGQDPLELAPLNEGGQVYAGTVAARAYILAHLGRHHEAADLLPEVIHVSENRDGGRGRQIRPGPGLRGLAPALPARAGPPVVPQAGAAAGRSRAGRRGRATGAGGGTRLVPTEQARRTRPVRRWRKNADGQRALQNPRPTTNGAGSRAPPRPDGPGLPGRTTLRPADFD